MKPSPMIRRPQSFLLLVDIQQKLAPAIDKQAQIIERNHWLLAIARDLTVPVVVTEQYPQGLGPTVESLMEVLNQATFLQKTHFSALAEPGITETLRALQRPQVVLTGTESHVCVLQTALDLQTHGFQVFVVADAVGSRRESDRQLALNRLSAAGCTLVSSEMVAFEWLHQSATDEFRHISRTYLR